MTNVRIAVVILDQFADWEVGVLAAAARSWLGAEVRHYSPGGGAVRSMGGLSVTPDAALDSLDSRQFEALALIGSAAWEASDAPDVGELVRDAFAAGRPVGAICGATLAVARAGVLAGRRHTSNARQYLTGQVAGYDGSLYVDTPRAVIDNGLVTAAGSAPVSFATGLLGLVWPGHLLLAEMANLLAAEHLTG
jgi:putative intracellular protease/amidase